MSHSANTDQNIITGTVIESLPNTRFLVQGEDGKEHKTYLAGKMKLHRIKVLIGDKVEVLVDEYGGPGRIVRRVDKPRHIV